MLQSIAQWKSSGVVGNRITPTIGTGDINLGANAEVDVVAVSGHVSPGDVSVM